MAWQTPKTDWTAADGVRDTDMNRIEGNALALYNETVRSSKIVYVTDAGNDSTGNGTSASPYRTINKALSTVPKNLAGISVTIHIASGAYPEAVSVKGFHGGVLTFAGTASEIEVTSLTIDGSTVSVTSLDISATAAVGIIITNAGTFITTGNVNADGTSTGVNVNSCSSAHIAGSLYSGGAAYAIQCSRMSSIYADTISGVGILSAVTGGVIAFNNSTMSRSTATGGRIYNGSQSSGGLVPSSVE